MEVAIGYIHEVVQSQRSAREKERDGWDHVDDGGGTYSVRN